MKHKLLTLLGLVLFCLPLCADKYTEWADRHWKWIQNEQTDSLLVHATDEVKAALPAATLAGIWQKLVQQAGTLKGQDDWEQEATAGYQICRRRLAFERAALYLNLTFDKTMKLAGISFTPAPLRKTPQPLQPEALPDGIEEQTFTVSHGEVILPGLLTLPTARSGKLPAVVLVHGSGPNDRNETIGPNQLFRELAYALAAKGIAVVRYDKRTLVYRDNFEAVSNGVVNYDTETVDDAIQALKQLAETDEIDASRLYVIGHSLGGMLAPRIVNYSQMPVAGIIGLAAPARPFEKMLNEQLRYVGQVNGLSSKEATQKAKEQTQAIMLKLPKAYLECCKQYNPLASARSLQNLPMLFIQGTHDYQVTRTDLLRWKKGLHKNTAARFVLLPEIDHLMRQLPQMAVPADYQEKHPVSPLVVEEIATFILQKSNFQ